MASQGITGANALFHATYREEIAILNRWRLHSLEAARRARAAWRARREAKKRATGAYDFPWKDGKALPKPEDAPPGGDTPPTG